MNLPSLLVASVAGFLALHYFLIPRATERWKAERTHAVVARAVTLGTLRQLRLFALLAALAFGFVYLVMGILVLWTGIERDDYGTALDVIGQLRGALGWSGGWVSTVTFLLLATALVVLVRRHARFSMTQLYEDGVKRELERLRGELERGQWEELEPTAEMLAVREKFGAVQAAVHAIPRKAPERERMLAAAAEALKELEQAWVQLDWARRIKPSWDLPSDDWKQGSWRQRLGIVLFSKGMFRTAGDLGSGISRAALLLFFVSLVGIQSRPLAEAADQQAVRLSELVASRDKAEALESARHGDEASADTAATEEDEALDELGRRFEQAFANSSDVRMLVRGTQAARQVRELTRTRVRGQILDEIVRGHSAEMGTSGERLGQYSSLENVENLTPEEKGVLDAARRAAEHDRSPVSSIGQRAARDFRASGVSRTPAWQRVRADLLQRRAEFSRLASLEDIGGDMVNQAMSSVLDEVVPKQDGAVRSLAEKLERGGGRSAVKAMYEIKRDAFIADIAKGVDVQAAIERVVTGHPRLVSLTTGQRAHLHDVFRDVPSSEQMHGRVAGREPRLRWEGTSAGDDMARSLAMAQGRAQSGDLSGVIASADNLATYEDYFPGQRGGPRTARAQVIEGIARSLESGPSAAGSARAARLMRRELAMADELVGIATNARSLSGFFRVGGVIIGEPPGDTLDGMYGDIAWSRSGDQITISLVTGGGVTRSVGTFRASLVRQALAYAADDRKVAVTLTSAADSRFRGLKVHLHPALVDTPLGNDVIEVDRFVDTYVRSGRAGTPAEARVEAASTMVRGAKLLYQWAWYHRLATTTLSQDDKRLIGAAMSNISESPLAVSLAERALANPAELFDPATSPLAAKPEFYDRSLVAAMQRCTGSGIATLARFALCVRRNVGAPHDTWQVPAPSAEIWSGVREEKFTPDAGLAFLRAGAGTGPLRFMLQEAFTSPGYFNGGTDGSVYVDSIPWEYPSVAATIHQEVGRRLRSDPRRTAALERVREFVLLQRMFRTILDGGLGDAFPEGRLVALARETSRSVVVARTPRWNYEAAGSGSGGN